MSIKSLIKSIRKIYIFNVIARKFYKIISSIYNIEFKHFVRVKGTVKLKVNKISFKMKGNCDDNILDQLYFNPEKYKENSELKLFIKLIKNSKTFIDVGANTGLYTILGEKVNPALYTYSFEPYPNNYMRLVYNININELFLKLKSILSQLFLYFLLIID